MPVILKNRVMFLQHVGHAERPEGERLCDQMQVFFDRCFAQADEPVAVFHDTSKLISASESYARAFGERFHEFDPSKVVLVGWMPQAWFRVLARFSLFFSTFDMKFYKTPQECYHYLLSKGLVVDQADFEFTK